VSVEAVPSAAISCSNHYRIAAELGVLSNLWETMPRRPHRDRKLLPAARGSKVKTPKRRDASNDRRKAEEQSISAPQLQAFLNVLPAYTWYAAPAGALTFVNKRTGDYLGLPKDHPLRFGIDVGAQWDDWIPLLHPDDREKARQYWSTSLRTGHPGEHSYRVRGAEGDYHWFFTSFEPLRASDGTLLLWLGATLDIEELKSAEEAVRGSEYKLRQIIETLPSLLWSTDPNGEPTHINQRMLDYSGMRFEDFTEAGWRAFLHPDDRSETVRAFSHAVRTGTSYRAVNRVRRADGEFRWHHTRGEPLRDGQGHIIQWYGLSVDIDDAKRAEDRLRRSEAYLAEAQRLSHTATAAYNETAILYWTEEASLIFGFDPLQGVPSREAVWQRIHPDDVDWVNEHIEQGVREKRSFRNEFRIILPDGTVKHIEAINHPVFSASGDLVEILSTGIDVTERKRAEQALRESEAKFRDYAETASDWFWEIGRDYKFTLLTKNAFGSHASEQIGVAFWGHSLDHETEPEKWRLLRETLDSRKSFRDFVYCSAAGSGAPMYVRVSGKPVFDANGEFRGYRGTGTDATAIMRAQRAEASLQTTRAELARVSRITTLGQLTASIAHEINQPIAAARNNASAALNFLDAQPPDLGEVREALGCVIDDNDRAGAIIDRIRDQIKKAPPQRDRFDLNEAINQVIVLARGEITKNGVSVHTHLTERVLLVEGDRVQLQQVILNLVLNAVEAMSSAEERARELWITTEQGPINGVLVAVRDSGPGIDPERLDRVFDAFYTTKQSGLGMGLSICCSIITDHGGRLWAEVNQPRGAIFQFTLPSVENELANAPSR
jgi:PAS domain S-box-containing protein